MHPFVVDRKFGSSTGQGAASQKTALGQRIAAASRGSVAHVEALDALAGPIRAVLRARNGRVILLARSSKGKGKGADTYQLSALRARGGRLRLVAVCDLPAQQLNQRWQ
jgi:hypothetical protein